MLDLHGARWTAPDRYEMRPDAGRFELWERSPALLLGMGRAAGYAMDIGLDAIWERVRYLSTELRSSLTGAPGVKVHDIGAVKGAIVTFTVDRLAYSPSPPIVFAVVDFDGGGRMPIELTDVDPAEVAVGGRVAMTFRRLHSADGIHNYFWKARPVRG